MSMDIKKIPLPYELEGLFLFIRDISNTIYLNNSFLYIKDPKIHPLRMFCVVTGKPEGKTKDYWIEAHVDPVKYKVIIPVRLIFYKSQFGSGSLIDIIAHFSLDTPNKIEFCGKTGSILKRIDEKTFWVIFKEDVGGCSLDGQYEKGTILALKMDQLKNDKSKNEIKKKQRPNYKRKTLKGEV